MMVYLTKDKGIENNRIVVLLGVPHVSHILSVALIVQLDKLVGSAAAALSWGAEIGLVSPRSADGTEPSSNLVQPSESTDRLLSCKEIQAVSSWTEASTSVCALLCKL